MVIRIAQLISNSIKKEVTAFCVQVLNQTLKNIHSCTNKKDIHRRAMYHLLCRCVLSSGLALQLLDSLPLETIRVTFLQ